MARKPATTSFNKTNDLDFLFGKFKGGEFSTPYFQTTMTFKEAADWLKLVNEMPNASILDWKIEELFQREIDWKRVDNSIVPYLNTTGPKFFNSITIALMPIINNEIKEYGSLDVEWHAPKLDNPDNYDKIQAFGPITCGYFGGGYESPEDIKPKVGHLCWNTDEICGVAIDGQHRLAAIKAYVRANLNTDVVRESRVPVILLLLDPILGFTMTGGLISTIRRLFIDLNKNAKIVKRARQILLDDRDPRAMCVRSLVGPKLCDGLNELLATPPTLPLTLIDWHSEQAKFDDGPYITTILGLDWAIGKGFDIKSIDDPTDHDGIKDLLNKLKSKSVLGVNFKPTFDRLQECADLQRPFTLNDDEMVRISNAFKESFNKSFCHLLTNFEPYVEVINLRKDYKTLNAKFANWFPLYMAASTGGHMEASLLAPIVSKLTSEGISVSNWVKCVNNIIDHKKGNIAFTVVFQRALILAFINFQKFDLGNAPENYGHGQDEGVIINDGEPNVDPSHAEILVKGLNTILKKNKGEKQKDFLDKHFRFKPQTDFWLCSILSPTGTIDFTEIASKRASDILHLIGLLQYFKQLNKKCKFLVFYNRLNDDISNNRVKVIINKMITGDNHIADLIVKILNSDANQEMDKDEVDKRREREILERAEWIWNNL